jgi:osmotically-inducible protein OsmY
MSQTMPRMSILIMGIAGLLSFHPGSASDSSAADLSNDARREVEISTIFALSPILRNCVVKVTISGHNASIVGKVGSVVQKDFAEAVVKHIDGVTHIDNLVGITDNTPLRGDGEPDLSQNIADLTTTASIRAKLSWSSTISDLDIGVTTTAGNVRLNGSAHASEQIKQIERLAADTGGVRSVDNDIVLSNSGPAHKGAAEANRPMSDSRITARIKSTFLFSPSVSGSDIDVVTREGVVSLSGSAGTLTARTSAIDLASNTRGVQRIDATLLTHK